MLLVLIAAIALLFIPKTTALVYVAQPIPDAPTIEEKPKEWTFETMVPYLAEKHGQDEALVRRIIDCESDFNPNAKNDNYTDDGEYWSSDHGYWQINDYFHEAPARYRGFDIYIWEENLEWGFIVLKEQGTSPWEASAYCWNV